MHERAPMLKVSTRDKLGSRYAARDRSQGQLPGIIYGHGQAPVPVNFEARDAVKHIQSGEKVFRLDFPGTSNADENQMVLLKDVQFDYLGSRIIHADFMRVDLNERVRTRVHINLKGDAKGLKTAGAILMHPASEIEIECRVRDLPEQIDVDVTDLDVGQTITADQVKLPAADMKLTSDGHAVIAQIQEQKEVVTAEATAVAADAVQPEVIGEKERAEKAAAEGDKKGGAGKDAKAAPAAKK